MVYIDSYCYYVQVVIYGALLAALGFNGLITVCFPGLCRDRLGPGALL